jgi:hypothetical protein
VSQPDTASPTDESAAATPKAASTRWSTADDTVRQSSKWIVTAITGFTGVVFASGGFLVKGSLGESYFWQRAIAMSAGGLAAALGLAAIIGAIVSAMTPVEPTLDTLPPALLKAIERAPERYFPDGCTSIQAFRERWQHWDQRSRLRASEAKEARNVATAAQAAYDAAKQRTPAPNDLDDLRDAAVATASSAAEAEAKAAVVAENFALFVEAYQEIVDQARYVNARTSFTGGRWPLVGGGVLVILGAIAYTTAVSYTPPTPPAAATTAPQLAMLKRSRGPAGAALWEAAGLAPCESSTGVVPVLLASGDGSAGSPWQVQTLGRGADDHGTPCAVTAFAVRAEVATVVVPKDQVTIEYTSTTTTAPASD